MTCECGKRLSVNCVYFVCDEFLLFVIILLFFKNNKTKMYWNKLNQQQKMKTVPGKRVKHREGARARRSSLHGNRNADSARFGAECAELRPEGKVDGQICGFMVVCQSLHCVWHLLVDFQIRVSFFFFFSFVFLFFSLSFFFSFLLKN